MTLLLKQVFNLLKLLNSDTGTISISSGIALGFVLGMSPFLSLQGLLILMICLFFRVQLGAVFVSAFFFSFIAYLLDPMFHSMGENLLTSPGLVGLWTTLFNMPLIPLTRFNNSIVMGAGALGFALTPIVFLLSNFLIKKYRTLVVEKIKDTKLWKAIKATSLFKWYHKYDSLYG
ncbi:MAG: TIGR03546 family protein [Halobacteriovoraceae bacterium]|nr:TIGR03546 family protein [Halobacteriovoraceae bacterium]